MPQSGAASPQSEAAPVVLVVDDYEPLRYALSRLLQAECRVDVVMAQDGLRAMQLLEARRFDVVVADQRMPGVRGMQLLATVRARWPETRRVLLTGAATSDQIVSGVADAVLDKALGSEMIVETICALAKGRRP